VIFLFLFLFSEKFSTHFDLNLCIYLFSKVSLFNMLFCGALAQKESFVPSLAWIFRLAPMSYAYEGMMINEMVGLVYNLG